MAKKHDALNGVPEIGTQATEPEAVTLLHHKKSIEVVLGEPLPHAYRSTHIDVHLDQRQAEGLRRLYDGLDRTGAKLSNGRHVQSAADAVKWLLDQVA